MSVLFLSRLAARDTIDGADQPFPRPVGEIPTLGVVLSKRFDKPHRIAETTPVNTALSSWVDGGYFSAGPGFPLMDS
jgi:hypothetical protein